MADLKNEIIAITGGSLGIGYATALRLGKLGAKISLCSRREEPLRQAEKTLQAEGVDAMAFQTDISNEDEVERWFSQTEDRFGPVSILVNNAGISGYGRLEELTAEQWDRTMSVNCRGAFLCSRRALPAMIGAHRGRIVFISSASSLYYRQGHALYFASKWALNGFAHCLAKEVNEHHIHIHIICPGMTETNFFDAAGQRPHAPDFPYVAPGQIAEMVEHNCLLPQGFDTNEYSLFPSWQLKNFGVRR